MTKRYSTSFSASSRLFSPTIRRNVYAIYGLVRIADEVVDTYKGQDTEKVLKELQKELYVALDRGYSTNPIIEAFVLTAITYKIDESLIEPFFKSMMMDLNPVIFTKELYKEYIYGSAEVIGSMCLRVFCEGDDKLYKELHKGARALGAAYQKVNFLRDMAADYHELGRVYFPDVHFGTFNDDIKQKIIVDIEKDFLLAKDALKNLPDGSRRAVEMSVVYYEALLKKLKKTPSDIIKQKRIRISNAGKTALYLKSIKWKKNNG
ncbi:MAG: phytoene/squalene synthase family protein [Candidatus Microsaccharimonas sp.]